MSSLVNKSVKVLAGNLAGAVGSVNSYVDDITVSVNIQGTVNGEVVNGDFNLSIDNLEVV